MSEPDTEMNNKKHTPDYFNLMTIFNLIQNLNKGRLNVLSKYNADL